MLAFEKIRGLVIWDWCFSGRRETISTKRKVTKERVVKILFKNYLYTQYSSASALKSAYTLYHKF